MTSRPDSSVWATHTGGPESLDRMPVATIRRATVVRAEDVAAELCMTLGSGYAEADLVEYADKAICDLTGSVAPEALPEMAARLAAIRLTSRAQTIHDEADDASATTARLNGAP